MLQPLRSRGGTDLALGLAILETGTSRVWSALVKASPHLEQPVALVCDDLGTLDMIA